jgi:NAD(P)H-hydrate epimerase
VAARHLAEWGYAVRLIAMRRPENLKGDAAQVAGALCKAAEEKTGAGLKIKIIFANEDSADIAALFDESSTALCVDALFGTGLSRPLTGQGAHFVQALNDWRARRPHLAIVAVDLPSGLPTDGEAPRGPCVKADHTVTFGQLKVSHLAEPGLDFCGAVECMPMGLLLSEAMAQSICHFAPPLDAWRWPRPSAQAQAHKGHFGHVAVLGGAPQMAGAGQLAARAALRMGAGLVTLHLDQSSRPQDLPAEVMFHPWEKGQGAPALDGYSAVVVGPGLGQQREDQEAALQVMQYALQASLPLVVDADALPLLAQINPALGLDGGVVATPHPKEAGTLIGWTAAEVQANRPAAMAALVALPINQTCSVTWVLKGASPLVGDKSGLRVIVRGGNPILSVAGSGDVLAGAIAARLAARGITPMRAAIEGVWAHQEAGHRLGEKSGRGALAGEIADALADDQPIGIAP